VPSVRRGCPESDRSWRRSPIPTIASRPRWTSGSMTPPLPSPPITAPVSFIRLATLISPTGVRNDFGTGVRGRCHPPPASWRGLRPLRGRSGASPRRAVRAQTPPPKRSCILRRRAPLFSVMRTRRSTSGSTAIPRSAFSARTARGETGEVLRYLAREYGRTPPRRRS